MVSSINVMAIVCSGFLEFIKGYCKDIWIAFHQITDFLLLPLGQLISKLVGMLVLGSFLMFSLYLGLGGLTNIVDSCGAKSFASTGGFLGESLGAHQWFYEDWEERNLSNSITFLDEIISVG